MKITGERLNELKSQIKIEKPLSTLLQESLVVGEQSEDDSQPFSFDIKILHVEGALYKSGKLEVRVSSCGVELEHVTVDLSEGEFCGDRKLGKIVGVKYCFYLKIIEETLKLYTSGEIDGWFEKRAGWNDILIITFHLSSIL